MYKIVIIDEGGLPAGGIIQKIPWEKYGCRLAGAAGSRAEGLELVGREQPDLLIINRLPCEGDRGALLDMFRENYPRMKVVFSSGSPESVEETVKEAVRESVKEAVEETVKEAMEEAVKEAVGKTANPRCPKDTPASSYILKNALAYIDANYKEHLTLNEVAEHAYVSQWHLSKLLNRHLGQNFSEILNKTRIEHAKTLLRDPSLRIGHIAETVGFIDIAHFSRVFKKIEGVSANEYRNRHIWED